MPGFKSLDLAVKRFSELLTSAFALITAMPFCDVDHEPIGYLNPSIEVRTVIVLFDNHWWGNVNTQNRCANHLEGIAISYGDSDAWFNSN